MNKIPGLYRKLVAFDLVAAFQSRNGTNNIYLPIYIQICNKHNKQIVTIKCHMNQSRYSKYFNRIL